MRIMLPRRQTEEIHMLELYRFEECEYSQQVRLKMSEWEIDCILRNVARDKSRRPFLKKISGRSETPTLVDSTRNVILVGDEQKIIRHVGKYYRRRNA
jgi:glutaredoxin